VWLVCSLVCKLVSPLGRGAIRGVSASGGILFGLSPQQFTREFFAGATKGHLGPPWGTVRARYEQPELYLGRDNHLTDWPEREPSKLQMRPSERDADNGYGEQDRSDYVREREPPAGED
jgi:hypothetical protein